MDKKIIEEIRDNSEIKMLTRYCNKVIKKLSFKSSSDMTNLAYVSVLLYIFDKYEDVINVHNSIKDLKFTGDHTLWGWVEFVRMTAIRVLRSQGKDVDADEILETLIPYFEPSLYNNQREMLSYIYDRNINVAIKNGSKAAEIDWKIIKFGLMIQYYETPDFPIDKKTLNEDIVKLKNELQTKIK